MPQPPKSRWGDGDAPRGDAYDERWRIMEQRGENPHGEADFVMGFEPRSVLDAGCGTGRVAIELDRRGVTVVGVDLDPHMLVAARKNAPDVDWHEADLVELEIQRSFEVVVAAGNVMIFLAPGTEAAAVARMAAHVEHAGHLIAGFQLRAGGYGVEQYDQHATAAGLTLVSRFAGWHGEPYEGGDYAVTVHRRS